MKNKIYTIRWRELTRFKPYDHDDDGKKESCEDLCRSRLARRVILSPLVLFVLSAEPDKIMGHLRAMEFFAASAEKIFSQNEVIFKSCRRIFLAWIRNDGESFVCFFAIEWNFTFGTSGSDILSRWFFFFFLSSYSRAHSYKSHLVRVWIVASVSFLLWREDRVVDLFLIAALVVADNFVIFIFSLNIRVAHLTWTLVCGGCFSFFFLSFGSLPSLHKIRDVNLQAGIVAAHTSNATMRGRLTNIGSSLARISHSLTVRSGPHNLLRKHTEKSAPFRFLVSVLV